MRLKRIYISIAMVAAGLAVQAVLASPATAALYVSQGIATSTNLLSGSSASSITNFHYNIATLPATSSVRIQFSKNNTNWYSSAGTPGGWDTLALGQADLSLAAFVAASSWTNGDPFYYKLEINSTADLSQTPTIDDIRLDYTPASGYENVFVFDNFGNVGIGTTSPSGKLDIHGAGTATGVNTQWSDLTGAAKVSILDNGNVGIGTTLPSQLFQVNNSGSTAFVITSGGNVGIGATSPGAKLEINNANNWGAPATSGAIQTYGTFRTRTGGGVLDIGALANGSTWLQVGEATALGTNYHLLLQPNGGNVGIGTTSPNSKLSVSSTATSGTMIAYAASSAVTLAGAQTGLSLDLSTNYTNVTQAQTGVSVALKGASAANAIDTKGLVVTSGAYNTTTAGASTWTGLDLTMPAITQGAGSTLTSTGIKITGGVVTSGTSYALTTDSNAGNVGIGTTSPLNKLHVQGTGAGAAGIYMNDAAPGTTTATLYNSGGNLFWAGTNLTGGGALPAGTTGQTLYNNAGAWTATSNLFHDGTNVGIGTTAVSSAKLVVNGNIFPDSNLDHSLGDDTHRWADLFLGPGTLHIGSVTGDEGTISYATSNNVLQLQSTGNLSLQPTSGNVGIGTTAPTNMLDVAGGVKIGAGYAGIGTTAPVNGLLVQGNVGIGTTAPNQQLEITGSLRMPATTSATTGVIYKGTSPFVHDFTLAGTSGANTFVGLNAGNFTMTGSTGFQGSFNTAIGASALTANTTGSYNMAMGAGALAANTTGSYNVAMGSGFIAANAALRSNTSGVYNTAVGNEALNANTNGSSNTAIGASASRSNTTSSSNTAIGTSALYSNTIGYYNVAIGASAGAYSQTGFYNAFFGTEAGAGTATYTGSGGNVIIGYRAGYNIGSNQNYNVFLGYKAGYNEAGSNKLWIANSDTTSLVYGNFSTGAVGIGGTAASTNPYLTILAGGNVGIGTTGPAQALDVTGMIRYTLEDADAANNYVCYNAANKTLSDCTSLRKYKEHVSTLGLGLETVMKLNPVEYTVKTSGETTLGFIAEEVEAVSPLLTTYRDGKLAGVKMPQMSALLTRAVQEQQGMISEQGTRISEQQLKITETAQSTSDLQAMVNEKLSIIYNSLSGLESKTANYQLPTTNLETKLTAAQTRLAEAENNLATFETATNDTLSTMIETENMLTQRVLNHEDRLKALEDKVAVVTVSGGEIPVNVITADKSGNATLAGIFKAKEVQADGIVAGEIDAKKITLGKDASGTETLKSGETKTKIQTSQVSADSKIYVTPLGKLSGRSLWVDMSEIKKGESFTVQLDGEALLKDIEFNWLIVN